MQMFSMLVYATDYKECVFPWNIMNVCFLNLNLLELTMNFVLVFQESGYFSASKRMSLYCRQISFFVFFHVFVSFLVQRSMLKSTALRVGVTTV